MQNFKTFDSDYQTPIKNEAPVYPVNNLFMVHRNAERINYAKKPQIKFFKRVYRELPEANRPKIDLKMETGVRNSNNFLLTPLMES